MNKKILRLLRYVAALTLAGVATLITPRETLFATVPAPDETPVQPVIPPAPEAKAETPVVEPVVAPVVAPVPAPVAPPSLETKTAYAELPAEQAAILLEARMEQAALDALAKKTVVKQDDGMETKIVALKQGRAPLQRMLLEQGLPKWDLKYVRREVESLFRYVRDMHKGHAFAFTYDKAGTLLRIDTIIKDWNRGELYTVYRRDPLPVAPKLEKSVKEEEKTEPARQNAQAAPKVEAKKSKDKRTETAPTKVERRASRLSSYGHKKTELAVNHKVSLIEASIEDKGESLTAALRKAGASNAQIKQLTDLFNGSATRSGLRVDLNKVGKGDKVKLLVDTASVNGEATGSGKVVFAEVTVGGHTHIAQYKKKGDFGYYVDEKGHSLQALVARPNGRFKEGFGIRAKHPVSGKKNVPHKGQDYAGVGSIVPVASGVVVASGWQNGYGYTAEVAHPFLPGFTSFYAHMAKPCSLAIGTYVVGGVTELGEEGATGRVTGKHLHVETRRYGEAFNPENVYTEDLKGKELNAFFAELAGYRSQVAALHDAKLAENEAATRVSTMTVLSPQIEAASARQAQREQDFAKDMARDLKTASTTMLSSTGAKATHDFLSGNAVAKMDAKMTAGQAVAPVVAETAPAPVPVAQKTVYDQAFYKDVAALFDMVAKQNCAAREKIDAGKSASVVAFAAPSATAPSATAPSAPNKKHRAVRQARASASHRLYAALSFQ